MSLTESIFVTADYCIYSNIKDHPENDGRSDILDRLEFMIVSNCCYPQLVSHKQQMQ